MIKNKKVGKIILLVAVIMLIAAFLLMRIERSVIRVRGNQPVSSKIRERPKCCQLNFIIPIPRDVNRKKILSYL